MNGQGMNMWLRGLACAVVVASAGVSARGQGLVEYGLQLYPAGFGGSVQRIDDGDPTMVEVPGGVANTGVVVGGQYQNSGNGHCKPFVFQNSVYEMLPVHTSMQGNPVMPWDVSADGSMAIGEGLTSQGGPHGAGWALNTPKGHVAVDNHLLHELDTQGFSISALYGMSPDGNHAVGIAGPMAGLPYGAMLSDSEGMTLETPFMTMSMLTAVSSQGEYSTGVIDENTNRRAVRYEKASGQLDYLGSLVPGDPWTDPRDISPDGQFITGMAMSSVNTGSYEAFGWTGDDGIFPLGFVDGTNWSAGMSTGQIGGKNVVVGGAGSQLSGGWIPQIPSADERAFIWIEDEGSMVELQGLLENQLGIDLQGWTLNRATDISPDGTHIAGIGMSPMGEMGGWVVTMVPEPATMCFLAMGGLAVIRRRRK
jgi:hypothetical protein